MKERPPSPRLIVCDVDGVVFRGQFLLALARCSGLRAWLASVTDCLLYEWGRVPLEHLLRRVYGRAAGAPADILARAYARLPLTRNVAETIRSLRRAGHEVWLASAGVPQEWINHLVRRTGASGGAGISAPCEGGRFTGRVDGELSATSGKFAFVERLLAARGLDWTRAVVIGDDRNNLEILERAGVSIGFRATYAVRQRVRFIVDGDDFARVAAFVDRAPGPPRPPRRPLASSRAPNGTWIPEVRRKFIHAGAALTPLAHRRFPEAVALGLGALAVLYLVGEFFRLNGTRVPVFDRIMSWTARRVERRRPALAPVTLAAGVLLSLGLFRVPVAYAAILIAAISDSVAAIVGERWGRVPLPHNPYKSLEGTLVGFAAAIFCASVYLPLAPALAAAAVAAALESFDLGDWDNLLVPLAAGGAAAFLAPL